LERLCGCQPEIILVTTIQCLFEFVQSIRLKKGHWIVISILRPSGLKWTSTWHVPHETQGVPVNMINQNATRPQALIKIQGDWLPVFNQEKLIFLVAIRNFVDVCK
jgi:hypothetical protein